VDEIPDGDPLPGPVVELTGDTEEGRIVFSHLGEAKPIRHRHQHDEAAKGIERDRTTGCGGLGPDGLLRRRGCLHLAESLTRARGCVYFATTDHWPGG